MPVHLGQPLLAAGFGGGDYLGDRLALTVVLGQELGVVTNIGQVRPRESELTSIFQQFIAGFGDYR